MSHVPSKEYCFTDQDRIVFGPGSLTTELENEFVDAKGVATYLKISEQTVRNMTSNGRLPHYKFGRLVRYRISDLRRLLLDQPKGVFYGNKS